MPKLLYAKLIIKRCLTNALIKNGADLLQPIPKPFLALHLRFEPDLVAYSQCQNTALSTESMRAIDAARGERKPWTEEAARICRKRRKCPVTPRETTFILLSKKHNYLSSRWGWPF